MGADNRPGSNVKEADGFYLGPNREELLVADKQARQKIAELEARIAELEAQPQIWAGTDAQYEIDNAAGKIKDGAIVVSIPEGAAQQGQAEAAIGVQGAQEGGQP
ncbi:MAG: hypothetical protein K2N87_18635 [Eubacterium sp.]|nr:hypothetical protein [Eubacterium sp.]